MFLLTISIKSERIFQLKAIATRLIEESESKNEYRNKNVGLRLKLIGIMNQIYTIIKK